MGFRRYGDWLIPVLISGNVFLSVLAGFNDSNAIVQSLDCSTDFIDRITCDIKAANCSQYTLHFKGNKGMSCKQEEKCRCYVNPEQNIMLIYDDTHTVSVWKGDESLGTRIISINDIIVPRVPTVVSVKDSNGKFEIMWKSNMETNIIDNNLMANVSYFKKGDAKMTSTLVTPTTLNDLKVYSIPGQDLEPSTTYVVCVRSYSEWSGRSSGCSAEKEFTTPISQATLTVIIITILSVAVIFITSAAFVCFVKLKALYMDTIANYPKPKILLMNQSEPKVLKPVLPVLSVVHMEPLMADDSKPWLWESIVTAGDLFSGVQSDNSLCSSPSNLCARADDATFGSCSFDNRSYFIVLPDVPGQDKRSEVTPQGELLCDPAYQAAGGDSGQQLLTHLLLTSASQPPVDTDTGYQVQKADLPHSPHAGDSSCSSSCSSSRSGTLPPGLGANCDDGGRDADADDKVLLCEEELFFSGASAGSNSPGPVDFSYQTFQSLVEASDVLSAEKRSAEQQPNRHPEEALSCEPIRHPVASCCPDEDDSASPTLQTAFFSLLSADQSIIVEDGYQSVEPPHVW